MKISVFSDIHEGLNRKNTKTDILDLIEKWIEIHSPDVFIIGGDMTARPKKALVHLNRLQIAYPKTKVLFVHGNHDIYGEDTTKANEALLQFTGNLGNGSVQLTDDWVIIGDGGWYDYSFVVSDHTTTEFTTGI